MLGKRFWCAYTRHVELEDWNELRTAAAVARSGTVSAAAALLRIHRATVARHVDALEARLGAKLFQRHARGFTPTELGHHLLRVADATEAQFGDLLRHAQGAGEAVDGEVILTCLDVLVPLALRVAARFREAHTKASIRLIVDDRILRLAYGEAHLALRIGPRPEELDNIVLPAGTLPIGLYAARSYLDCHGRPPRDLSGHAVIGTQADGPRIPSMDWLAATVPPDAFVLRTADMTTAYAAVRAGLGIGMHPRNWPESSTLVELVPPLDEWDDPVWGVTHRDLHRSAKVQAVLDAFKDVIRG